MGGESPPPHTGLRVWFLFKCFRTCLLISPFASQNAAISGENVQFQCTVPLNVRNNNKKSFLSW